MSESRRGPLIPRNIWTVMIVWFLCITAASLLVNWVWYGC